MIIDMNQGTSHGERGQHEGNVRAQAPNGWISTLEWDRTVAGKAVNH